MALIFKHNLYNELLSWCGSFYFVRSIVYIATATHISTVKMFIHENGFKNGDFGGVNTKTEDNPNLVNMDPLEPIWISLSIFFLCTMSIIWKRYLVAQQFKTEQHPYYTIGTYGAINNDSD